MPERIQLIGGSEEFTLLEVMHQAGRFIWKFTYTETQSSTPGSSMVVHSGPCLLEALWPTHKTKMFISLSDQKALHVLDLPFSGSHLPQVHSSAFVHFLHTNWSFRFYDQCRELLFRAYNSWQICNKSMKWTSYSKRRITDKRTCWHKYMLEMIRTRGKLNTFLRWCPNIAYFTLLLNVKIIYWLVSYSHKYHGIILTSLWVAFLGAQNWEHSFNKHILTSTLYQILC